MTGNLLEVASTVRIGSRTCCNEADSVPRTLRYWGVNAVRNVVVEVKEWNVSEDTESDDSKELEVDVW